MLAYDPVIGVGYNLVLTILSLLIAVLITGAGLGTALLDFGRWTAVVGGAIIGGGIAAMHYTGMMALELPGRLTWAPNLVVASIALGISFGALALYFAARRDDWVNTSIAIVLFALAILFMHFTAMGAVLVVPDPTRINNAAVAVTRLSFPCHCRCSCDHSRYMSRRGIERPAIESEFAAAENPARHRP